MYINPNKKLLNKLDLTGFKVGDVILFCECLWQTHEPGIGMKNECPNCRKKGLEMCKIDNELIKLKENK